MDFSAGQYLLAAAIVFASSVLQGVVGFASGLFGIPLLLMSGLSLPQAVTVNVIATLFQTTAATYKLRHEIVWRQTVQPVLIRLSILPVGIGAMWLAGSVSQQHVKQMVGGVLLVIVFVQWLAHVHPVERLHEGWQWLAFSVSGFLLGFCGMGGPPIALWVMAHDWSSTRSRAFMFFLLLTALPPNLAALLLVFGDPVLDAVLLGVSVLPLVFAGTYFGLRLGAHLPKPRLRQLTYVVLLLIGLSAVLGPLLK